MSDENRFCLVQDEDSHWYIVPVDELDVWENWSSNFDSNDEDTWDVPACAVYIDNPFTLTFSDPRQE